MSSVSAPPAAAAARRSSIVVGIAAVAAFTANLDLSIVNLALPHIGAAFGVGQSTLAWTVNAYVLPYAVSILAVGTLADRFGHGRVLGVGAVLFAVGALVSAFAGTYPALLAGRVLQGVGGAALLTVALAVVSSSFEGAARGRALGLYFASGATAAVVGPIVGGLLTSAFGWPAMFWCQVPLALAVAAASIAWLPSRGGAGHRSLDVPALVLGTLVLLGVNVALLQADAWGWTSTAILGAFALAATALALFVVRERTAREPAVRLEVFRSRAFVGSALVGGAAWFGILSGTVQLAIYLQGVRGLDTTSAALVLLPWPLLAAILFPRASTIVGRVGTRRTMVGSVAFAFVAALLMVPFDTATPLVVVSAVAAIGGVPMSLGVVASTMTALAEFSPAEAGVASGVFNALRQVGASLGVAIPAAAFDLGVRAAPGDPVAGATAAFLSRAIVFGVILVLVAVILPRAVVRPRPIAGVAGDAAQASPADAA
jgi:EmrB/QacA subfamily drug resistance transporter